MLLFLILLGFNFGVMIGFLLFVDVYEKDEIYDDFERLGDFFVGCLKYLCFNDCFNI